MEETNPYVTAAENLSVLHVNTSDRGGGAESVALDLHKALTASEVSSCLAVGFRRSCVPGVIELPRGDGTRSSLSEAAYARGMPRLGRIGRSLTDPGVIADLARGHEDFRFPGSHALLALAKSADVIHLHNLHGAYFDLRMLPSLSHLRPVVLTLHDEWTFTGHCALTLGCERWREQCGSCPHLDVYPRLRRDGTQFNLNRKRELWSNSCVHIVAPTHWLLERAKASVLQGAATSWTVVSNGVDLDTFRAGDRESTRAALGISADASVVSFAATAARTNEFKDFATLERALRVVGASEGHPVVALTIGAEGETKRFGRVEVRTTGFLERPDVARHFKASDLYVHVARAETQGLSLMEALATGTPAIASDVGGVPEVLRNDVTGMLIPPGDPRALATAIVELLGDPVRRLKMSRAAVDDARLRFGHADHVSNYLDVYASARSQGARTGRGSQIG
jgi:glycosyltransferase involved in cell wall biosynthesis